MNVRVWMGENMYICVRKTMSVGEYLYRIEK